MAALQGAVDAWKRALELIQQQQQQQPALSAPLAGLIAAGSALQKAAEPFLQLALVVEHGWRDVRPQGQRRIGAPLAVDTANVLARAVYELDRGLADEYGDPVDTDAEAVRRDRAEARVTALEGETVLGYAARTLGDAFATYATTVRDEAKAANKLATETLQGLYRTSLRALVDNHVKTQANAAGATAAMSPVTWRAWIEQLRALKMPSGADMQAAQARFVSDATGVAQMASVMADYLRRRSLNENSGGGGGGGGDGGGAENFNTQATLIGLLRDLVNQNAALRGAVAVVEEHAATSDIALATYISDLVITPPPPPPSRDADEEDDAKAARHAEEIRRARDRHNLPRLFGAQADAAAQADRKERFDRQAVRWDTNLASTVAREVMWAFAIVGRDAQQSFQLRDDICAVLWPRFRPFAERNPANEPVPAAIPSGMTVSGMIRRYELLRKHPLELDGVEVESTDEDRRRVLVCSAVLHRIAHFRLPPAYPDPAAAAAAAVPRDVQDMLDDALRGASPAAIEPWLRGVIGRSFIARDDLERTYATMNREWRAAWQAHIGALQAGGAPARVDLGQDATSGQLLWACEWMAWKAEESAAAAAEAARAPPPSWRPPGAEPTGDALAPFVGGVTAALEHANEWFRGRHARAWDAALKTMAAITERSKTSWIGAAARAYLFATAQSGLAVPYPQELAKAFQVDALPVFVAQKNQRIAALQVSQRRASEWRLAWADERRSAFPRAHEFAAGVVSMNRYIADVMGAREVFARQAAQLRGLSSALSRGRDALQAVTAQIAPVLATLYGYEESAGNAARLQRINTVLARAARQDFTHIIDADDVAALSNSGASSRAELDQLGVGAYALLFLAHVRGTTNANASVLGAVERIATVTDALLTRVAGGTAASAAAAAAAAGDARAFPWADDLARAISDLTSGVDSPARLREGLNASVNETARNTAAIAADQVLSVHTRTLATSVRTVAAVTRDYVARVSARVRGTLEALLGRQSTDTVDRLQQAVGALAAQPPVPADAAAAAENVRRQLRELTLVTALADTVVREHWANAILRARVGGVPAPAPRAPQGALPAVIDANVGGGGGGAGSRQLPINVGDLAADPAPSRNVARLGDELQARAMQLATEVAAEVRAYEDRHALEEAAVARELRSALADAGAYQANLTRVLAAQQHEQLNRDANREATRALLRWSAHFQHLVEYRLLREGAVADRNAAAYPRANRPTSWLLRELKEYQNEDVFEQFAGYREGIGVANADPPRVTHACGAVLFTVLSAADRVLVHMAHLQDWWRRGHINGAQDVRTHDGPAWKYMDRELRQPNMPAAASDFLDRNALRRAVPRNVDAIDDAIRGAAPRALPNPVQDAEGRVLDAIARYADLAAALVQLGLQLQAHFVWHRALRGTSVPEFPRAEWNDDANEARVILPGYTTPDGITNTAAFMLARGTRPTPGRAEHSEEKEYDDEGERLWLLYARLVDAVPGEGATTFGAAARQAGEPQALGLAGPGRYNDGGGTLSYAVPVTYGDAGRLTGSAQVDALFRTRLRWLAALQADTYSGVSSEARRSAALAAHRPAWEPYCAMAPPVELGAGAVRVRSALAHLRMADPVPGNVEDGAGWRQELFKTRSWWLRILKAHLVTADVRERAGDDIVRIFNEVQYAGRVANALEDVRNEAIARARDHMDALRRQRADADAFMHWVAEQAVGMLGAMARSSEMRAAMERAADAVGSAGLRGLLVSPDARLFAWRDLRDARAWTALVDAPAGGRRPINGGPVVAMVAALGPAGAPAAAAAAAAVAAAGGGGGGAPGEPTARELCERMPTMAELLQALANELDERWTNLYARLRSAWPQVRPEEAEAAVRERAAALESTQARLRVSDANLRLAEQKARENDAYARAFANLEDSVAALMREYYRQHPDAGVFDPPSQSATVVGRMLEWIRAMQMAIERGAADGGVGGGGRGGRGGRRGRSGGDAGSLAIARPLFHAFIAVPPGGVLDRFAHWLTLVQGAAEVESVTRMFNESMLDVRSGGIVLSTHARAVRSMSEIRQHIQTMRRMQERLRQEAEAKAEGVYATLVDSINAIDRAQSVIDASTNADEDAFADNVEQFRENVVANPVGPPIAVLWYYLRFILSPALYAHVVRAGMLLGSEQSLMAGVRERARSRLVQRPQTTAEKASDAPPVREPMDAGAAVFEVVLADPDLFRISAELVALDMRRSELETSGLRIADSDGQADMGRGRRTGTGGHVSTAMLVEQFTILDQRKQLLINRFKDACAAIAAGGGGGGTVITQQRQRLPWV